MFVTFMVSCLGKRRHMVIKTHTQPNTTRSAKQELACRYACKPEGGASRIPHF